MFIAFNQPTFEPAGPDFIALPGSGRIENQTPRALHARLLANAALRRQRGIQRRAEERSDDARYWITAAFAAVSKAAEARTLNAPLP